MSNYLPDFLEDIIHHPQNQYTLYISKQMVIAVFTKDEKNWLKPFSHSHPEYEFIIPLTPIPCLRCDGANYFGETSIVYPVQSEVNHGITYAINDISFIMIIIRKAFLDQCIESCETITKKAFIYEFAMTRKLNDLITLFKEDASSFEQSEVSLRHISALIGIELAKLGLRSNLDTRHQPTFRKFSTLKDSADYIIANLAQDFSVVDLAAMCNLSQYHYIRMFKETFGDPPYKYLLKARVSTAAILLKNSALAISDISFQCGFPSPNRFSVMFKSKLGMTPSEYRKGYQSR
ncbi:MAG: AraC family transcriptional regulator [Candidatus Izemoplasmatales bacterium]|jgi:AraC-like DNA-binding protein|nr:AraC family transcriptional regulator [Candidatus Izemoplasmatales bacterium]MDD4596024.1 AraC family transcriptional regulator [Candidatus Izemoplasmatales bacterium]